MLPKNLFTTSIWPCVCGRAAVLENFISLLDWFHIVSQNATRNLLSRSKTVDLGTPCSVTIFL